MAPDWVSSDDYPGPAIAHPQGTGRSSARPRLRDGECHLWTAEREPLSVTVLDGRAFAFSGGERRQIAHLEEGGLIACDDVRGGRSCGRLEDGQVTIRRTLGDWRSEPIAGGQVRFPGEGGPTVYTYAAACSPGFAAVGAVALFTLKRAEEADEDARRRKQQ